MVRKRSFCCPALAWHVQTPARVAEIEAMVFEVDVQLGWWPARRGKKFYIAVNGADHVKITDIPQLHITLGYLNSLHNLYDHLAENIKGKHLLRLTKYAWRRGRLLSAARVVAIPVRRYRVCI